MTILVQSKFANSIATQEFTNSTAGEYIIDHFNARNNDAADQLLSVWIVPAGGTAEDSNKRLTVSVATTKTYPCGEIVGDILGPNDSLWIQAATASTISVRVTGRLRTA